MDRLSPRSEDGDEQDEPEVATPRHDPAAISKSQADAVYQLIQDLKEEGHLKKRRLHLDMLSERLSERYSCNKEDAHRIIAARASAVLEKLDEEDTPGFRWSRYVIHRELTHAATHHDPLPPALLTPLLPLEDSSDDEDLARTQKSVLRPKIASVSNKLMGKRNRNGAGKPQTKQNDNDNDNENDDEDEDDDTMLDVDTPSKTRGHELIRTPLSTRPQTRSFLAKPGPAASLLQTILQEPRQTSSIVAPTANHRTSALDATSSMGDLSGMSEPETWTCRMPGCPKVITSKGPERKSEIEDHAGEHDWETQMRVELVESERRMHSTMPVSNLMQWVISQHYQQMREAFPEIYPTASEGQNANGNSNGAADHSLTLQDGKKSPDPNDQLSAEEQNQSVNGHKT